MGVLKFGSPEVVDRPVRSRGRRRSPSLTSASRYDRHGHRDGQCAGATLVKGNLQHCVRARQLSRVTVHNIRQYLSLHSLTTRSVFTGWLLSSLIAALAINPGGLCDSNALRPRAQR